MIRKSILFLLSLAVILSCHSRKGKLADAELDILDSLELAADLQISEGFSGLILAILIFITRIHRSSIT